jgi:hypothetical protein
VNQLTGALDERFFGHRNQLWKLVAVGFQNGSAVQLSPRAAVGSGAYGSYGKAFSLGLRIRRCTTFLPYSGITHAEPRPVGTHWEVTNASERFSNPMADLAIQYVSA